MGRGCLWPKPGTRGWDSRCIEELRDYFTLERHGHVGILAVTEAAEGRGAGGALLRAAEAGPATAAFGR